MNLQIDLGTILIFLLNAVFLLGVWYSVTKNTINSLKAQIERLSEAIEKLNVFISEIDKRLLKIEVQHNVHTKD
jgi:prefoldin subunit 5